MKKGHLLLLVVFILVLMNIDSGKAQSLVITKKDGTYTSGLLSGSKVAFSGSNLIFTTSIGGSSPFAITELAKLTFNTKSTSINNETGGVPTLTVYPNPATSFIRVGGLSSDEALVQIFRIDGVLVFSGTVEASASIGISSLTSGVYIVKANGQTSKFIKK